MPGIVKPDWEGSSKGIRSRSVVKNLAQLEDTMSSCKGHRQPVLVEEFIPGDKLTVGVVGNDPPRIVGVMRVVPRRPTEHSSTVWK